MAGPLPTLNDTTQKENLFAASLASCQSGTINEESPFLYIELLWNYCRIIMELL